MLNFKLKKDGQGQQYLETDLAGKPLQTTPQLNKGTAFDERERIEFDLLGKLPERIETLEEQIQRVYVQFGAYKSKLQRNIYLNNLHDRNQTLFYKLVSSHLSEMIPIIYTPIVGNAVKKFSQEFRQPRGLYISYPNMDRIGQILDNRSNPDIDLIVVTDGEGVLGIGDQGIGGMDIPVAKLMVYSLCGGINPTRTLPILLDVGTNNEAHLADPLYLGWRHRRVEGADYDNFIAKFIQEINKRFPTVFLHWEDFGRANARRILEEYQDEVCTFNDDIQGTGSVALAALMAAVEKKGGHLPDQRIIVYGAGTAGTGISDQICDAMVRLGLTPEEARKRFWLVDRDGLLLETSEHTKGQQQFLRKLQDVEGWEIGEAGLNLATTVHYVKPTILIGCSSVTGAFTQEIIEDMAAHCEMPIILPLSNPTERAEAEPQKIMEWTRGRALIATGSPFPPATFEARTSTISQCNNALVFPGLGLGITAVKARRLTDDMIWAATQALSAYAPIRQDIHAPLLPSLEQAPVVARKIALAVAQKAIDQGLAQEDIVGSLESHIESLFWTPAYVPYYRIKK